MILNKDKGFVHIFRDIRDTALGRMRNTPQSCKWKWCYVELLLEANFAPQAHYIDGKVVTIERGEILTRKEDLGRLFSCTPDTAMKLLRRLQRMGLINVKTSTKLGTRITILDYPVDEATEKQRTRDYLKSMRDKDLQGK